MDIEVGYIAFRTGIDNNIIILSKHGMINKYYKSLNLKEKFFKIFFKESKHPLAFLKPLW